MKLYGLHGSPRISACTMVLEATGIAHEVEWIGLHELKSEKVLQVNPQGKVPVLVTPEGPIYETTAICRYAARTANKLFGTTAYETALVDQWLSFVDSELNESCGFLLAQLYGLAPHGHKLPDLSVLKASFLKKFAYLNTHLQGKTYLVGADATIADLVLFNFVYPVFAFTVTEKERQALPNLTAFLDNLIQRPEVRKYFGRLRYAQEPWKAPKIEAPKAAPAEKKPAAPKEEKKAQKHEEDEIAEPKPKEPVFPETAFNLMNFKTFFINEKDFDVALDGFWRDFKEGEWSLWHLKYLKYPGECEVVYRTNNLLRTFFSRLENIRKYIFGTHFVLGDEPSLEVEGVWLIRGSELFEGITEIDVYDTYKWTKLDSTKEETKAVVRDFWTHRKEDEEKVAGMTVRTFKWVK